MIFNVYNFLFILEIAIKFITLQKSNYTFQKYKTKINKNLKYRPERFENAMTNLKKKINPIL